MKRNNPRACFLGRIVLAMGALALWTLSVAAQPPMPKLPADLDRDGDGFYDRLETALGSDLANKNSTPESHALADDDKNKVADACEDFLDNDGDGDTDSEDEGCEPLVVSADFEPGLDIFNSRATIEAGALGYGLPPQRLELAGPVVVKRGDPGGDTMNVEMEAMQLTGGGVVLLENPRLPSQGTVVRPTYKPSPGVAPYEPYEPYTTYQPQTTYQPKIATWSSRFEVHTLLVRDGKASEDKVIKPSNDFISRLPPVQDSRKVDPDKCYKWDGGLHCPEVPVLRIPVLKYVAKFDCGEQPSTPPPFLGAVKPGDYATKIVIHNPHGVEVTVKKKVSVGKRNPHWGQISEFQTLTLPPDATTEVDCPDIYFNLLKLPKPENAPLPFKNGVVVILSEKKLDVIANYTQEVPKEKIEFTLKPPMKAPEKLKALTGKRLKLVHLVTEDTIIDEEEAVRKVLSRQYPEVSNKVKIKLLGDDIGVGAGIDIEEIRPQHCVLIDPPDLPDGQLECEAPPP